MNQEIEIKQEQDLDYFDIHRGIDGFVDDDKVNKKRSWPWKNESSSNIIDEKNDSHAIVNTPAVLMIDGSKLHCEGTSQKNIIHRDNRFQCQEKNVENCYLQNKV